MHAAEGAGQPGLAFRTATSNAYASGYITGATYDVNGGSHIN